jgi:Tol biopolymer transport system component
MAAKGHIGLDGFHPIRRMKQLLFSTFVAALFTNCSEKAPNRPLEEPPPENGSLRKIVFNAKDEQGRYKLYTISEKGTGLKEIFSSNAGIADLWVSPKGDRVVCCVNVSTSPYDNYQLFLINIDGRGVTQITHYQNGILEEPQWFPNGEEILFGRSELYGGQFYRVRIDGSNLTRITSEDSTSHRHPRLSPDAQKIAFETRGPKNIRVINIDGTNNIMLSTLENEAYKPEWALDSKKVLYGDRNGLWIVDAEGNNRKRLSDQGGVPHVSPINGVVVFLGYYGIYTVNLNGSELRQVISINTYGYPILWSHDGAKIAFRGDANGDRKEGICIVNTDGTDLKEITPPELEVEPSPCRAFDWIN